jgi:eukaryotic-like serine/threonine-protein kinase
VLRAMAKDPAQRYQSAADMRTDIQRALSGVPVAAPRTGAYGATQRMGGTTMTAGPTRAIPGYEYGQPEDYPPGGGRRRLTWLWWAAGALLVLAVIGGVAYAFLGSGSGGNAVPQVNGLPVAQAETQVRQAGLVPKVVTQSSSTISKGDVISTNPPNGNKVPAHTVVTLYVSGGPSKIAVPNVVGLSQTSAENKLSQFNVKTQTDSASTKPAGTVVRQNPAGGTQLLPGSTVVIYVSGGGSQVPDVRNNTAATARQILQNDGFQVNTVTATGPPGTLPGLVFNQSPSPGSSASPGSTVTIYVEPSNQPTPTPSTPTPTASSPTPTPT